MFVPLPIIDRVLIVAPAAVIPCNKTEVLEVLRRAIA